MAKAIHTMIRVLDEKRSVDFYTRAFGSQIADRFVVRRLHAGLSAQPGSRFRSRTDHQSRPQGALRLGDGYGHVAVAVDDIEAEHARFEREGFKPNPVKEFHRDGALLAKFFFVADPDGYKIEVLAKARPLSLTARPKRPGENQTSTEEEHQRGDDNVRNIDQDRTSIARQFLSGRRPPCADDLTRLRGDRTRQKPGVSKSRTLKPEAMRTLIKMARDIFPHDRIADKFYAARLQELR